MGFLRMTEELRQTLIIAEHGAVGNRKEAPVVGQCHLVVHDDENPAPPTDIGRRN